MVFIFCLVAATGMQAQGDTVRMQGHVLDSYTKRALAGVSVINSRLSVTVPTDGQGYFEIKLRKDDDVLLFYPGYRTTRISLKDSAVQERYTVNWYLEPLSTGLDRAVIIKAPKTLEEIEEDRKKLGITPKELDRPEIMITSPISALYEMFSGHAQQREKLKGQIAENDRRKIFVELLNFYNENELIDLPDSHYDAFVSYCNLSLDFLKYSSDYEITKTIVSCYNKYGLDTGLIK